MMEGSTKQQQKSANHVNEDLSHYSYRTENHVDALLPRWFLSSAKEGSVKSCSDEHGKHTNYLLLPISTEARQSETRHVCLNPRLSEIVLGLDARGNDLCQIELLLTDGHALPC